ncbi:MAG: bifunctional metallophosphatase/5'-nucleotidase [Sulfuricaulis sp.]
MKSLNALFERFLKRFGWKKIALAFGLLLSGGVVIADIAPIWPFIPDHPDAIPLQILWTNDTHGFFLPVYHAEYSEIDSYAQTAATEGKVGGYAQIAGLVKKLKEGVWEHSTLFMDAGDTFDGSPVAQMTQGQAVVPVLNAMGYDAWTPGNRDFAWPAANFYAVTNQLTFPKVCANLLDATTGKFVFPQYLIKQVGGLKVAIIGLTSTAGGGQGFTLLGGSIPGSFAVEPAISALAAQIRATENPDLVVVLSHMGFYQDQKFASRSTGIDVIVGAHTHHNVFTAPIVANADGSRNVIVVQAGSHGKFLGQLQLWVKNQKVVDYSNNLVRVSTANLERLHVKPDPVVEALAEQAYAPFKTYLDQVVGYTNTVLERRGDTQSTMTNFLTDALAERYGVDGARFPGIRYGSSVIPGPITVGDVWNIISPNFGNNGIYLYTQTGAQILAALNGGLNPEYGTDPYNWNGGDVTRFNGRVKYTFTVNAPSNHHLGDVSITTAAGQTVPLMTAGVPVAANQSAVFTFASTFGAPSQQLPNVTAVDEIISYIQSKGTISAPIDDRAVQLDTAPTNITDIGTPPSDDGDVPPVPQPLM